MPEVRMFYGISIKMFFKFNEFEPSHVHVFYGEQVGIFSILTNQMIDGDLPGKVQELVKEWLTSHSSDLQKMWENQIITKL